MPFNPNNQKLTSTPIERANDVNDTSFENQTGYFPYDLFHQEFITPRFGEITPSMCLLTAPGDRHAVHDGTKTILTQINGNFLQTMRQYIDSWFIPLRSLMPNNYEKFIANPSKGDDLPMSAHPMFPIWLFLNEYLYSYTKFNFKVGSANSVNTSLYEISSQGTSSLANGTYDYYISRLMLLSYVFSRGQLFDYLGYCFDQDDFASKSKFQAIIDKFFAAVYRSQENSQTAYLVTLDLTSNDVTIGPGTYESVTFNNLSEFRDMYMSAFESGKLVYFPTSPIVGNSELTQIVPELLNAFDLTFGTDRSYWDGSPFGDDLITEIDENPESFTSYRYLNITSLLAYQQLVAQFYTNDSIDNIFNSDLYMQLLRSVLYPNTEGSRFTKEPTFLYNGVSTEYDYISFGGMYYSLISDQIAGKLNRQYVWLTVMCILRRSLRYGDYFSTARPRQLAVGQLSISVEDNTVSPIDVTKNLLTQRYLNAVNYIGSGFMQYMQSMYGVTPKDVSCTPRYVAHRVVELTNDIVTNTAENQGKQTTNLIGYSDENAFDVFIDDHGILISVVTYDVLPVYKSGIDPMHRLSDRFDYFNSMLQNIGDQQITLGQLYGNIVYGDQPFGWTMRNAEYKYKISRAHGAFVNSLPGFLMSYPMRQPQTTLDTLNISPDFIRDKPFFLDSVVPESTGVSPAEYFHFVVSVNNTVNSARKIQQTPAVLF